MKLILPLRVILPRKKVADKKFSLNLNVFRNAKYFTVNDAKKAYVDAVRASVAGRTLPHRPPLSFTYIVFPHTRRRMDLGNVLSIVQKFTEDALVELGLLTDDSYDIIRRVEYGFGQVDSENPRVELTIHGYEEKECCQTA
jgi:hypothetical protein